MLPTQKPASGMSNHQTVDKPRDNASTTTISNTTSPPLSATDDKFHQEPLSPRKQDLEGHRIKRQKRTQKEETDEDGNTSLLSPRKDVPRQHTNLPRPNDGLPRPLSNPRDLPLKNDDVKTIDLQLEHCGKSLGYGRCGAVFKYRWGERTVAIKVFAAKDVMEREMRAYELIESHAIDHLPRFYGRARLPPRFTFTPSRTNHVPFLFPYTFGIVLELIEGRDLDKASRRVSDERLVATRTEMTVFIAQLRTNLGLIHGDIRAQNVLLTGNSWVLVDMSHCLFRTELPSRDWSMYSERDDMECRGVFIQVRLEKALPQAFKILDNLNLLSEESLHSSQVQLVPLLRIIERRPHQAISLVDLILQKIPQPTYEISHFLAHILCRLRHFSEAHRLIELHLTNPSTPLSYRAYFHQQRVNVIKAHAQTLNNRLSLLSALKDTAEAFSIGYGETHIKTVKALQALSIYLVKEMHDPNQARLVNEELTAMLDKKEICVERWNILWPKLWELCDEWASQIKLDSKDSGDHLREKK